MEDLFVFLIIVSIFFLLGFISAYFVSIKYKKQRTNKEKKVKIGKYRCLDGHLVRSKGELIIDNYLFFLGISHVYEKVIILRGNNVKCDWFLPKFNLYIEYWGYSGEKYNKRKEEKLKLYHKEKIRLISIENWMFYDIYTNINRKLEKYMKIHQERFWKPIKKFCSNCGSELDERF